jgi:hypothetical protein
LWADCTDTTKESKWKAEALRCFACRARARKNEEWHDAKGEAGGLYITLTCED